MPSVWIRPQQKPDPDAIPFYFGGRAAQDESGRVLAERYELVEVLANGGTAVVYNAVDTSTGGSVAVKVLYEAAREAVGAFFGQEGRLAARIQSPHLVHARHFGEDDGCLFIVFELVPGHALPDLYFMQLMPWRELFGIVLQVLAGLDALHQVGIVHRDVKPDNIIVNRTLGDEVHVTLLDLGFAWVPPERRLTGAPEPTRQVFGTDGFIAPELLGGGLPEPRNDLYSVGAMMYLMLTAQRVPDLSPAPELMDLPSPRAFVPGLPQSVDDIVMRALSDVESRFQNAEEMAAAIRAVLTEDSATSSTTLGASRTTPASPPSTAARGWHEVSESAASSAPVVAVPATSDSSAPVAATTAEGILGVAHSIEAVVVAPPAPSSAAPEQAVAAPSVVTVLPAQSMVPTTSSMRWMIAAALLLGTMIGGVAVGLANRVTRTEPTSSGIVAAADRQAPGKEELQPSTDRPAPTPPALSTESKTPAEPMAVQPPPGAKAMSPAVLAAGGKTRSRPATSMASPPTRAGAATPTAGSPETGRAQGFSKVMEQLEPSIRGCIVKATGKKPDREIDVRVRFDLTIGAIDQVRVLDLGAANPISRCIDEAVRGAAPPSGARPNESFTFFKTRSTALR
jgi:serine/threonine-protein kinase